MARERATHVLRARSDWLIFLGAGEEASQRSKTHLCSVMKESLNHMDYIEMPSCEEKNFIQQWCCEWLELSAYYAIEL